MKGGSAAREAGRTLLWLAAAAAGIFAARAAGIAPGALEWLYTRRLYPVVVALVGFPGRRVSFSVIQILIVGGTVFLLVWLFVGTARSIRRRSMRRGLGAPSWIAAGAAILIWGFQLTWGLNHARPPLSRSLGLARVEPTPERLARLVRRLAKETNETLHRAIESGQMDAPRAGHAPEPARSDSTGDVASALRIDGRVVADRLAAAYGSLLPETRRIPTSVPKEPRIVGWFLPRLGISGFYMPYTAEATVAAGLPDPSRVFVMAHEMAHQRGVAGEDEANFLAFLACRESGLAAAEYAGALGAFNLAYNALWRAAPDSVHALRHVLLEAGPRTDRRAIRAWWDRRRSALEPMSRRTNDAYLKASGHRLGVASYGEAVRLLLAWEESEDTRRDTGETGR